MKRPFCATILLWLVLSLAAWSGLRLVGSIFWWSRLSPYTSLALRIYLVASGLIWFSASLFLLWLLMRGKRNGLIVVVFETIAFSIWFWLDRWIMSTPGTKWGFYLGATFLLLVCVILCAHQPKTKEFFYQRENHEEKSENR